MKRLFHLLGLTLTVLLAYSCYDDSWVRESIENIQNRFLALEQSCKELNEEVQAVSVIVNALNTGDLITSVTPLMDGNTEIGYKIEFVKGNAINVYHGRNGKDGKDGQDGIDGTRPDLGIRMHDDGVYYWTLNNDWLLDDKGNKIKAVATDGAPGEKGDEGAQGVPGQTGTPGVQGPKGEDGITPKLKIENDYWYVSYDNGVTWEEKPLGKAVGEDGADGGDSVFESVKVSETYVSFTLKTGETFKINKVDGGVLNIIFDVEQGVAIVPGTTLKIGYTIVGGDENTLVRTFFTTELALAIVKPTDAKSGYIYIYVDDWSEHEDESEVYENGMFGPDITTGVFYDTMRSILVSVSDGKNNQVLKSLNIVKGRFEGVQDAFCVDPEAAEFVTTLRTNVLEGSYKVEIPENAKSWLTYVPGSKATMRSEELKFRVTANNESRFRAASVSLKNNMNQTLTSFVIAQRSVNANEVVKFEDEFVAQVCIARYDKDNSGDLTYEELALVTDIDGLFNENRYGITSFDEFQYFTSVTTVPESMFSGCENLKSITLPDTIVEIGNNAFERCWSLTSIVLPSSLERIGDYAFGNSGLLGMIEIPASVKYISYGAFSETKISEAKMLPINPPAEYDDISIFPYGTVMYVPDKSVEAYKKTYLSSYDQQRYTILPMSTIDYRIGFTYETLDEGTYINGQFRFPMSLTLTGDISKVPNVSDYGYFYDIKRQWDDYADYQYVSMHSLNTARKVNLRFDYDYYSNDYYMVEYEDHVEFIARMGAYVRFENGSILRYDATEVPLRYSSNVWIDFTGVENVRFDDYLSFTLSYNAGGTFFLENEYGGKSVTKATMTRCWWRFRYNDTEEFMSNGNIFLDGNNMITAVEIPIKAPTDIKETLYFTLTLMDDYERISETIHFAYSPDGTITAQLEGEDDDNNSDLAESLSNYSVRLNTFEQKWSSYGYTNDSDVPGYYFFHGMKLCVEADEKLLENSQEIGVYCRYGEDYAYTSTIPLTSGVVNEDYYYYFTRDFYNCNNYKEAYASYDVYIGTYAILTDGTAVTYNEQPFTFSYDRKPEVTLLDSKRNLYSAEVTEGIKYSYDDAGNVTDSTMVKEMLYNYNDTLRFNVSGGAWITNMYHANKNSQKTYYRLIADEIYDGGFYSPNFWGVWESDSSRTISEYILYYDYTVGGWKTSTNQLIPTWYSDNTCSLEVYDKTPEDPNVITTKSLAPNKGPVATKGKTVIKMINVDDSNRSKCKPANMKRSP